MPFLEELDREIEKLRAEGEAAARREAHAPEGKLRASIVNGKLRFYLRKNSADHNGTYLSQDEGELIRKLAQHEYDQLFIQFNAEMLDALMKIRDKYSVAPCDKAAARLAPGKLSLVTPPSALQKEYVEEWLSQDYPRKGFDDTLPDYYSVRNDRVRSKSEALLADFFIQNGIPFLYEKPVMLKNFGLVTPDFTLLNVRTRKEFVFEHFGMIDMPNYRDNFFQKLRAYEDNGYIYGVNFLYTLEDSTHPLNMKTVRTLIDTYLK